MDKLNYYSQLREKKIIMKENPTKILNELCVKYLRIDVEKNPVLKNKNFFSKDISAKPRDLMVFMLAIEKELCIKFSDDFILKGGMKNYQSIVDYINI